MSKHLKTIARISATESLFNGGLSAFQEAGKHSQVCLSNELVASVEVDINLFFQDFFCSPDVKWMLVLL
jgi:hypothetical protein